MHHLPFMSSITKKTQQFWNNLDRRTEETEVEALAVQRLMKSKPSISA